MPQDVLNSCVLHKSFGNSTCSLKLVHGKADSNLPLRSKKEQDKPSPTRIFNILMFIPKYLIYTADLQTEIYSYN